MSGWQEEPPSGVRWAQIALLRLVAAVWALPGSRGHVAAPKAVPVPVLLRR